MMESLVLFDSVVNSRWFMRTSIILFLNKVDLFKQKLGRSPLGNYFPDYSGGNDVNRAAKYLLWRFNQVNRAHLNLYPQYVYVYASRSSKLELMYCFKSYTSHRHIQHPTSICCCEGHHPSQRASRLGHIVSTTILNHLFTLIEPTVKACGVKKSSVFICTYLPTRKLLGFIKNTFSRKYRTRSTQYVKCYFLDINPFMSCDQPSIFDILLSSST